MKLQKPSTRAVNKRVEEGRTKEEDCKTNDSAPNDSKHSVTATQLEINLTDFNDIC
jgi:hypothetical protein